MYKSQKLFAPRIPSYSVNISEYDGMRGLASNARAKNRILHCRPAPRPACRRPAASAQPSRFRTNPAGPSCFETRKRERPGPGIARCRLATHYPRADLRRRPLRAGRVPVRGRGQGGVDCRARRVHCCVCAVRTPAPLVAASRRRQHRAAAPCRCRRLCAQAIVG